MTRVEKHIVKNDKNIDSFCFQTKNLYNKANYVIRQEFIKNGKWIRYYALDKYCKAEEWPEYRILPSAVAQQTLMLLDRNWKSFFKAIKAWKKDSSKFSGRPRLPKYLPKETGRFVAVFTYNSARLKGG